MATVKMQAEYDAKVEQLVVIYHGLKQLVDNQLLSVNGTKQEFNNNADYFFFLHKQQFFSPEFEAKIDHYFFLDYAPIEMVVNKLNDHAFRSLFDNPLRSISEYQSDQLEEFPGYQMEEIGWFFSVRAAIMLYICLKYHDITKQPPDYWHICSIQEHLPSSSSFFIRDYISYLAKVYPNCVDRNSNLADIIVIPDEFETEPYVLPLYELLPWYKDYAHVETIFIHIIDVILPKSTTLELLKRKELQDMIQDKAEFMYSERFDRFLFSCLNELDLELFSAFFKCIHYLHRHSILMCFVRSKTNRRFYKKLILSEFRVEEMSMVEDVKINWVIHNMGKAGYKTDEHTWVPRPERIPISPSEPIQRLSCSSPMLIMPPLFGLSIIPDDVILSLNKSLKGHYNLISNVLLFIMMPYNKSFHKDTEYVVRRYTRELLAIEHITPVSSLYQCVTRSKRQKIEDDKYILNGKRTRKMRFDPSYKRIVSNPIRTIHTPDDYCNIPFFPWSVPLYPNQHGYLTAKQ